MNRPRESRGSQPSGVLLVLFVQAKRIKPFPCRELSRFSKPRSSSPQWRFRTNKIKTFPKGDSRFCKPQFSAQKQNFAQTKLNPLPLCLLETWSPCSRPFAILPVSAVSDAQKLATGNFLHVRACFCGTFCTPQKVPTRTPLPGVSRFCKPRFSSPQWRLRTNKIKSFAAPRPFRRPWRHPFGG